MTEVHPRVGVWIEMSGRQDINYYYNVHPRVGVWIEIPSGGLI